MIYREVWVTYCSLAGFELKLTACLKLSETWLSFLPSSFSHFIGEIVSVKIILQYYMISHSAWKWVHFSVCSAQAAEALESSHIHNNPEALYSMPIKRGQKAPSSQSLRTTMEVRDAMQQVHDLSSEDEMKESSRVSLYWVHWCTCKRYVGELRLFFFGSVLVINNHF